MFAVLALWMGVITSLRVQRLVAHSLPRSFSLSSSVPSSSSSFEDSSFNASSGAGKQGFVAVDEVLISSGGWGNFQRRLAWKLGLNYAFIGADMLLPAFLVPSLASSFSSWHLTPLQQQMISSIWFSGALISYFITGAVGDSFGRKPILIFCASIRTVSALLMGFSPTFPVLLLSRFLSSVGAAGSFNTMLPLLFEFTPPANRAKCKQFLALLWNAGVFYMSISAYFLSKRSWRFLSAAFIPSIPLLLWLSQDLKESPKFLQSFGRQEEAQLVLRHVATVNGRFQEAISDISRLKRPIFSSSFKSGVFSTGYRSIFTPKLFKTTAVIATLNLILTLTYYGLAFGGSSDGLVKGHNVFAEQIAASLFEIPGILLLSPLANTLGRKASMIILLLAFAASCIALGILPSSSSSLRFLAYLCARLSGQAASNLKWILNAEAYPTSCRAAGLSFASIAGQIGGILGPTLIASSRLSPSTLFAVFLLTTAASLMLLKETKGEFIE